MRLKQLSHYQQINNTKRVIRGAKDRIDRAIKDGVKTISEYKIWINQKEPKC